MEPNSTGSTATTTPPQGGSVQPAQPTGDSISIPRADYDKYIRYSEQVKGIQPFFEKAKAFGIKSPEDFDRYDPYFKTAKTLEERGIKPDMLGRMFSAEAEADLADKGNDPQFDQKKFREELMSEFRKESAVKEWSDLTKREKEHVDAILKEIHGEEQVDGWTRAMHERAVRDFLNENREDYPKEHPLHGQYLQPIGETHRAKAIEWFKAEKAKHAGQQKAAKADAAIASEKKGATPPAGRSGNNGPPEKKQRNHYDPHDDAAILAQHEAIKARRNSGGR